MGLAICEGAGQWKKNEWVGLATVSATDIIEE